MSLAKLTSFTHLDKFERWKLFFLMGAFFLVISAYTIVKELKDSIFMSTVGTEYAPWANIIALGILVPALLFYSFLVDKMRRYQLLYFYSLVYGIGGFVCAYLVGHPTIGISNTDTSPYRLFGWVFFFFIEGFSPFVVSVFWAFANSVYNPESAKNNYAWVVAGSKIGGMMTAGFAGWLLSRRTIEGLPVFSHVTSHQMLLYLFSGMMLILPIVIYFFIKKVPGRYLHGYEAAYQFEKERKKSAEQHPNIISGLIMLVRVPYMLGIFSMLFFYEATIKVLSFQRLALAQAGSDNISGQSLYLFRIAFAQHLVGFFISFIGTRSLLNYFGERICLLIIPISTGLLLSLFIIYPALLPWILILLRAINYAFSQPVRESLYIPTVKDMKFKSKSWIDAFGAKVAKCSGSGFNILAQHIGSNFIALHGLFFGTLVTLWVGSAYLLGHRFNKAIKNNEIIGSDQEA